MDFIYTTSSLPRLRLKIGFRTWKWGHIIHCATRWINGSWDTWHVTPVVKIFMEGIFRAELLRLSIFSCFKYIPFGISLGKSWGVVVTMHYATHCCFQDPKGLEKGEMTTFLTVSVGNGLSSSLTSLPSFHLYTFTDQFLELEHLVYIRV